MKWKHYPEVRVEALGKAARSEGPRFAPVAIQSMAAWTAANPSLARSASASRSTMSAGTGSAGTGVIGRRARQAASGCGCADAAVRLEVPADLRPGLSGISPTWHPSAPARAKPLSLPWGPRLGWQIARRPPASLVHCTPSRPLSRGLFTLLRGAWEHAETRYPSLPPMADAGPPWLVRSSERERAWALRDNFMERGSLTPDFVPVDRRGGYSPIPRPPRPLLEGGPWVESANEYIQRFIHLDSPRLDPSLREAATGLLAELGSDTLGLWLWTALAAEVTFTGYGTYSNDDRGATYLIGAWYVVPESVCLTNRGLELELPQTAMDRIRGRRGPNPDEIVVDPIAGLPLPPDTPPPFPPCPPGRMRGFTRLTDALPYLTDLDFNAVYLATRAAIVLVHPGPTYLRDYPADWNEAWVGAMDSHLRTQGGIFLDPVAIHAIGLLTMDADRFPLPESVCRSEGRPLICESESYVFLGRRWGDFVMAPPAFVDACV